MENYIKQTWYILSACVSKEQSFLIILYFAFTAFLENTGNSSRTVPDECEKNRNLRRLKEIFSNVPDCELKRAANDFERNIIWEAITENQKCESLIRDLDRQLSASISDCCKLENIITTLQELSPELDSLQFTPENLNRLIASFPMNPKPASMAELYCGLAGTGLAMFDRLSENGKTVHFTCEEQRKLYCDITRIRMFCHGITHPGVFQHDILESDKNISESGIKQMPADHSQNDYDLAIADLPKGNNESVYADGHSTLTAHTKTLYTEWMAIQKILDRVNEKGRAMIIVTKGALVRQREQALRAVLTERDWLEAVITLPANMYASSHMGFELLIFNKQKPSDHKNKVFMADIGEKKKNGSDSHEMSEETISALWAAYEAFQEQTPFSAVVSLNEIVENYFSWNPFLYIRLRHPDKRNHKTIELGTVAEIMRGVQITKDDEQEYAGHATHYWLNIRNIENGSIFFDRNSMLRAKSPDWESKFGIQEDDIIITSKGSTLKICIVEPDMPRAFLCGNLTRIRVNPDRYSSYVLYEYLSSEKGRASMDSIQSGTTIRIYNNTNLKKLQIPYYENTKELQTQLKQIYQNYRRSSKKIRDRFETEKKEALSRLH